MAQVSRRAFEDLRRQDAAAGAAGWGADEGWAPAGDGHGRARGERPSLARALRLGEVPRGMLAAVAVLAVAALVLGAVLAGRLASGARVLTRDAAAGGQSAAPAAAVAGEDGGADGSPAEGAGAQPKEEPPARIWVHVAGAVAAPGVYPLPEGSRAIDAVEAAGGLAPDADPDAVNLAAEVADGSQVRVPAQGEAAPAAQAGASSFKVNVNQAGTDELQTLPGVGLATAEAIVRERQENGPFASPEDLVRVPGIGEKKLARIIGLVTV